MVLIVLLWFNDNANFQHCLDIFDAVATDGKCEILGKLGLDKKALQNVANATENSFMDNINTWEGNVTKGIKKKGYTGVGKTVSVVKMKFQFQYGYKYLKMHRQDIMFDVQYKIKNNVFMFLLK